MTKKYVATRGVCIGVGRHLAAGAVAPSSLSDNDRDFLKSIGALVVEETEDAADDADGAVGGGKPTQVATVPDNLKPGSKGK